VPDAPPIGIDLGTTNSIVAVMGEEGPVLVPNALGETQTPSVVAIDDSGHLLVGRPALERHARGLPNTVSRFKSDMGSERLFKLGGRDLSATALSALVLRELKASAGKVLGVDIRRAVVTVPAWFGEPQRRATVEAAALAGLEVVRLVNEPTAAALAHGLHIDDEPRTIAVLDLGGGTFDITLIELFDGIADVRASNGDVRLGGEDVTDALLLWARRQASVQSIDPTDLALTRQAAEHAKRRLATCEQTELAVQGQALILTRDILSDETADVQQRMASCIREVLLQTGLRGRDVDTVLLVGGATRLPWMASLSERVLGHVPQPAGDVDHVVAAGAAVQAGLVANHAALRERMVTDVLTHSLGVSTQMTWGDTVFHDRFDPILHRGTTLPATRVSRYHTLHPKQEGVRFRIYEGERRQAKDNRYLGEVEIHGLPAHEDADAREDIDVRFAHDVSGLLEVEARLISTGATARVTLARAGVRYTDAEREEIEAQLLQLKTHPRDLLPNRWLLERATRVVELLVGEPRARLDSLLTAFESALEGGDPALIARRHADLSAVLGQTTSDLELELD